jgi:type I restriction enzyme S subunit
MAPEGTWRDTTLGDVATWSSGGTPAKSNPAYWGGDVPWVSPKDMKVFDLTTTQDTVTARGVDAGTRTVPEGSVFLVVRGMILAHTFPVCIAGQTMAFNQDVKALVPAAGVSGRFLGHWFVGHAHEMLGLVTESTHGTKRIDLTDLTRFTTRLPTYREQARIAEVLDTVDEAIRSTERVIAKLEQVKRGLLHDLLTRGIDDNGEIRDPERHPEQFKDTLLGRIPKAWDVGPLATWLREKPKNGYSPQPWHEPTGTLMLGLGCLSPRGFVPSQLKFAPPRDVGLRGALLSEGDLLISRSNTRELVGLSGVYRGVGVPCIYPDLMMRLKPDTRLRPMFLDEWLRSAVSRRQMQAAAVGTSGSMVKVSGRIVSAMLVTVPAVAEQELIEKGLARHNRRLVEEKASVDKLRLLKKGLMDDLLTGRVRVPVPDGDHA